MRSKTILVLAIVAAFVAGTITTGTLAYASGDKNGKPFEALWAAIHDIETAITDIELTPGPQGEPGPAGPAEFEPYTLISRTTVFVSENFNFYFDAVYCPVGQDITSGGFSIRDGKATVVRSSPAGNLISPDTERARWIVGVTDIEPNIGKEGIFLDMWAICRDLTP